MGSATVLTGQLPAARIGDATVHGGVIVVGCPTVVIGGAAFSLPSNFVIDGTPDFQSKVIRDLYYLSTLPSGQQLLARLEKAGETITIIEYHGTDNSFCSPDNALWARLGVSTGSTVQYSPGIAIQGYDSTGAPIDMPPQIVLGHELTHALANSEGTHKYGTDPSPPASEPTIPEEEAQAIGTGSHTGGSPSENSLRSDAGLPQRDNHLGQAATGPVPNLRPGGP